MKHLYFLRHGQSQANVDDIWGIPDSPLTIQGEAEARAAGADTNLNFDIIYTSPYTRARRTAELFVASLPNPAVPIVVDGMLHERLFGSMEHASISGYLSSHRYRDLDNEPGIETATQVQARAAALLAKLDSDPHDCILIVSHAAFGRGLLRALSGAEPIDDGPGSVSIPNAKVIQLI